MKEVSLVFYLLLLVATLVILILLFTGAFEDRTSTRAARLVKSSAIAEPDTLPPTTKKLTVLNSDTLSFTGRGGGGMRINQLCTDGINYYCNYTILNNTNSPNRYLMHMEVQEQKKNAAFLSIYSVGEMNAGYLDAGAEKSYRQAFPVFEREPKSRYRVYLQLVNSSNNANQFVCDGAMNF
jgi:hypothetical protein